MSTDSIKSRANIRNNESDKIKHILRQLRIVFGNLAINIYVYQQGCLVYSAFNYRFVRLGIFNFLKLLEFAFYLSFRSIKIFISDQTS